MSSLFIHAILSCGENTAAESSAYPYRQFMHFLNMHPICKAPLILSVNFPIMFISRYPHLML